MTGLAPSLAQPSRATYFTPASLECAAALELGLGPVLALDVIDARASAIFADRGIAVVACAGERRAALRTNDVPPVPSVLIGLGITDAAALLAAIARALGIAKPRADFAVALPATCGSVALAEISRMFASAGCVVERRAFGADEACYIVARRGDGATARVRFEGSCDDGYDGSLAVVNRQVLSHMQNLDPTLRIASCAPPLSRMIDVPDITVRHFWPPVYARPQTRYFVHMQPWEFGSLPVSWRDGLRNVDEVWCYTEYVAEMYRRAEFPNDRIFRMPLGFDPTIFYPRVVPRDDECVFAYVGGLIQRKGADIAIAAFARAFTARDNVRLIIKAHGGSTFYARSQSLDIFGPLECMSDPPRHTLIQSHLSENDVAGLYARSAAVLVPFRGEGFGLPALEAMACGTPVVYTRGGALDDFCDAATGYPIASRQVPIQYDSMEGGPMLDHGFFVEADVDDMANIMRGIYADRAEAGRRGAAAARRAHASWTWDDAARTMRARLREISRMLGTA